LKKKVPVSPFLLPVTSAKALIAYNVTKIATEEGWVHFKAEDDCIFSARTYKREFPSLANIIEEFESREIKRISFPKELSSILDRAIIFSVPESTFGADHRVTLSFENDEMVVRAESENGWFEEKASIDHVEEKIKFKINPIYLKDIIARTDCFQFTEGKVKFEGKNWIHIIALITTKEGEK
jgi:DNA polymerase III sliding clamp (beta) subunit (PCNA family)